MPQLHISNIKWHLLGFSFLKWKQIHNYFQQQCKMDTPPLKRAPAQPLLLHHSRCQPVRARGLSSALHRPICNNTLMKHKNNWGDFQTSCTPQILAFILEFFLAHTANQNKGINLAHKKTEVSTGHCPVLFKRPRCKQTSALHMPLTWHSFIAPLSWACKCPELSETEVTSC